MDIKKAFDRVPHKRLLWKLENMGGVRGVLLEWMTDYLTKREMRTVIKDTKSTWSVVTSGVPQGSVLAPIMFQIYINDIAEGLTSYINLFADDAKLMRTVKDEEDCKRLQTDLDRIYEWSMKWKLEFNAQKCHVMEMGMSARRPSWDYRLGEKRLTKSREEKDLGVIVQDSLSPERHINRIFGAAYGLLSNIRVAFQYMDADMMRKILTCMVRPKLEYAAVVWSPHLKKDVKKLERIQKAATKMVPELRDKAYEERLREMNLLTLQDRRERGDLITMYKLVNGLERIDRQNLVTVTGGRDSRTRGHSKKIQKSHCLRDVRKYSFPHRTVDVWNGLSEEVVSATTSVHVFKEKIDKCKYGDRTQ